MPHRFEDYDHDRTHYWLDREGAEDEIARRLRAGELTQLQADRCRSFSRDGLVILESAFDHALADRIRSDIETIFAETEGEPMDLRKQRFENTFFRSEATKRGMLAPEVLETLDLLLGERALPYQSLTWPTSSQIGPHSDSILMTSHPRNGLIAIWCALEDITPECGPVYGIPGSHRWPYLSAAEVGIPRDADEAECTRVYDGHYYGRMARHVAESAIEPYTFLAKKGDVLVWHSNLVHGAHTIDDAGATRMCLIVHYYGEACDPYSDLFHRECKLPGLR